MKHLTTIFIILMLGGCDTKTAKDYLLEAEKFEAQKNYKEAIKLLDKAIEKDKNFLGAYINRGADKSALGYYEEAIRDYEQVLDIDTDNTLALFNIGNNYKRLENYKKAVYFYNKSFDSNGGRKPHIEVIQDESTDNPFEVPRHEIHFERGIAYFYVDSLQNSVDDFKAAMKKNYHPSECHYWLGHVYLASGQSQTACANFAKATQLGNKDAELEIKKYCK